MKFIQTYLLLSRMMVLEQLPRGNVNIVIADYSSQHLNSFIKNWYNIETS